MPIVIVPPSPNAPAGKLADAELHFTTGPLAGLTLHGFSIWESQWPGKNPSHPHLRVTVPSREYVVGGEKRRFDLLRSSDPAVVDTLRDAILEAYAAQLGEQLAPEAVAHQVAASAAVRPRPQAQARAQGRDHHPAPAPRPATPRHAAPQHQRRGGLDDIPF